MKNANDFRSEKERGAAPAAPRLFVIGTPFDRLTAPEGTTLAKARVKSGQCAFRIDGELRPFETVFYRRHLLPVGEATCRSCHPAAERVDHGHSARL